MRVVIFHTHYLQPGGEDTVFQAEAELLRERGHEVIAVMPQNRELEGMPLWQQAVVTVWNGQISRRLRRLIQEERPDVVHLHNTFPLASPAVIHAAKAEGVPVVMTLHNYRLLCPAAIFFRDGRVCEDCLGKSVPWPGVLHGCWRGRAPTGVVAWMLTVHHLLRTWEKVDRFIALTEFARQKFIEGGLPAERIVVKPNFVAPDPGMGAHEGGFALFVGRLSPEKGVKTLLEAWKRLGEKVPLKVVGDGPLATEVSRAAEKLPGVAWLGRRAREEVEALMGEAAFLVFPSECYEGFPMVIAEAFARGLPVLATGLGSHGSLVEDGRTGRLFRPGDPEDLAAKVEWLLSHPGELARMCKEARAEYEAKYTADRNYQMLMEIYEQAMVSSCKN